MRVHLHLLRRAALSTFVAGLVALFVFWALGEERVVQLSPEGKMPSRQPTSSPTPAAPIVQGPNLTRQIAQNISDELIKKNPEGPIMQDNELQVTINTKQTLDKLLNATLAEMNSAPPITVSTEELIVVYSDAPEVKRAYFEGFQNIISKTIGAADQPTIIDAFAELINNKRQESLLKLIANHDNAIVAFKKLPVPIALLSLHKEEIILLMQTKLMLEGLLSYPNDPTKAYIAFNLYPKLVESASQLQKEFAEVTQREKSIF